MENGFASSNDLGFSEFIRLCNELVRFRVHEIYDASSSLLDIALSKNLIELDTGILWIEEKVGQVVEMVVAKGAKLERLRIDAVLSSDHLLDITKGLTKLKSLDIRTGSSNMSPLRTCVHLEEISWQTYHNEAPDNSPHKIRQDNQRILADVLNRNGRNLKSMNAFTPDLTMEKVVPILSIHCPKLESLIITQDSRPVANFSAAPLSALTKLRRIRLQFMGTNTQEVIHQVLQSCHKLSYINLIGRRFIIKNETIDLVANYASNHPKRAISLEIMEHRVNLIEEVSLPANLRIIDDCGQQIKLTVKQPVLNN
jgi:hypothetical protein